MPAAGSVRRLPAGIGSLPRRRPRLAGNAGCDAVLRSRLRAPSFIGARATRLRIASHCSASDNYLHCKGRRNCKLVCIAILRDLGGFMTFKSVFDPDFQYRGTDTTNLRLTFERIRREQRRAQRAALEAQNKVVARIGPSGERVRLNESQNT